MTDVAVWLSCYVYTFDISTYLTTVNQCLNIFFPKNYVSLKRSPLYEDVKSMKPLKEKKCKKWQRLSHFFNKYFYIYTKYITETWVNRRYFFIDKKNLSIIRSRRRTDICLFTLHDYSLFSKSFHGFTVG